MSFGNSIGQQGLFGSQTRPGMRALSGITGSGGGPRSKGRGLPARLGTLTGSSLGDDAPATADPEKPGTTVATSAPFVTLPMVGGISKPVAIGGAAVLAWYFLFRKGR